MAARLLAVVLTLPAVAVCGFQVLVVPLLMNICFDSCDSSYWELHPQRAAVMTAFFAAAFLSAVVFTVFVTAGSRRWATRAFVVHAALTLAVLSFWLQGARNSEGKLIGIGVGIELAALFALVICRSEARQRAEPRAA